MDIFNELSAIQKEGYRVQILWNESIRIISGSCGKPDMYIISHHSSGKDFKHTIIKAIMAYDDIKSARNSKQGSSK